MTNKKQVAGATEEGKADAAVAADVNQDTPVVDASVDATHKDTAADVGLGDGGYDQKQAKMNEIKDAKKVASSPEKVDADGGESKHYSKLTDVAQLRKVQQNYVPGSKEHGEIADRIGEVADVAGTSGD